MFSSDSNNIFVVDIDNDTIKIVYKGMKYKITCMMKFAVFYDFKIYKKNKSKGIDYKMVLIFQYCFGFFKFSFSNLKLIY